MAIKDVAKLFINWTSGKIAETNKQSTFLLLCTQSECVRNSVAALYKNSYPDEGNTTTVSRVTGIKSALKSIGIIKNNLNISSRKTVLSNFNKNDDNIMTGAAQWVWKNKRSEAEAIVSRCAAAYTASTTSDNNINTSKDNDITRADINKPRPFDRRLDRLESSFLSKNSQSGDQLKRFVPFSSDFAELSTTGYLISQDTLKKKPESDAKNQALKSAREAYSEMANNEFYKGVPALQNYYAIIRLYGSQGGKYLVNQKNQRRWYELDSTSMSNYNFASTPTTSALISWGQGDPYGRTPYQFTDFVFSKYWNKIANNRLITLRRYAAPILDNLKFPGMENQSVIQNSETGGNVESESPEESGSSINESVAFPPMATAITYFGGETQNSLNSILKFTTGVLWEDIQADVWSVNTDSVPSNESGPGAIFGGLSKFAEMLNVAGGNFDRNLVMNKGQLPPDPYENGPYENRIMGPLNRIDSIKKRKAGMAFEWDGLNLVFEYVARPVGGINPKAVLLDILSNFLVMGSASAVFFGGAHRFMAVPAKYPFIGGNEGIEQWYKGKPIQWALTTVKQFTQGGSKTRGGGSIGSAATNLFKSIEGFFSQLFSGEKGSIFGAVTNLFTGGVGNLLENEIAKKSGGQIPYLHNMKAILTGEPVGEWHVTIGNPLNPIAMIGNLICDGITVEFNEELGPDDFPTEVKITVKLKHAMARDRDAIESIFNRGMGRIYNLPDSFAGSADFQTVVDNATKEPTSVGYMPNRRMGILYKAGMDSGYIPASQVEGKPNAMGSETSIWNRSSFNLGISENSAVQFIANENEIFLSSYRAADWIASRSLT